MQQRDLFQVLLPSSTGVYHLYTAQRSALARRSRAYQLQAECYCALLLAGESSDVPGRLLHTSFGSCRSSSTTTSQHRLTVPLRYRLNTFGRQDFSGRWSYFVELCTVIQHGVLTVLGNYIKRNYLRVIKHRKRSKDAVWFYAILIHDWHWHWQIHQINWLWPLQWRWTDCAISGVNGWVYSFNATPDTSETV